MKKGLLICCLILVASTMVFAQNDGSQQNETGRSGTFAITNVKIVPVIGAEIALGTIVIADGKIAAVGEAVTIPEDAETIDGTGLSVYPGLIDAGTSMGLIEIGNGAPGTVDVSETGDYNPNAKAILGYNPNSAHINITRVNGITMVQTLPRGSVISGQSAVVNLNGETQDAVAVVPHKALVINYPTVSTFGGFNPGTGRIRLSYSQAVKKRDERVENLREELEYAEQYARAKNAATKDSSLPLPEVDLKMEALIPYIKGEKPVIFVANRARDIRSAVKFADEMKMKSMVFGGIEAWKEAELLRKHKVPVIYTGIFQNPGDDDPYDLNYASPSLLAKAGVEFCISTGDSGANARELTNQAGMASGYGLSKQDALRSVTIYPAKILGVADKVGSLEVGKIANVILTDGDPLEVRTNIKRLFIGGRDIPLTSRHTQLFDSFKDRTLPNSQ